MHTAAHPGERGTRAAIAPGVRPRGLTPKVAQILFSVFGCLRDPRESGIPLLFGVFCSIVIHERRFTIDHFCILLQFGSTHCNGSILDTEMSAVRHPQRLSTGSASRQLLQNRTKNRERSSCGRHSGISKKIKKNLRHTIHAPHPLYKMT